MISVLSVLFNGMNDGGCLVEQRKGKLKSKGQIHDDILIGLRQ